MKKIILMLFLVLASTTAFPQEEADHAIHEELRALLQGMQQAINDRRVAILHDHLERMRCQLSQPVDREPLQ